ncbi:SGNH/GDSL hydrolase family protein [Cryobacterium psychrophilum]|uniref:SGNH/GDSL hydrolase family protein n=1 Tax=Cryobacterium psychrophilum TaxID=41988 RepID=UPI0010CE3453|nr:SGNH/GDSL hydrolase family protein [Cryobacterium psychrophilum]TDW29900.1 lysophospholipase L1-like esterase [Cryobacterium psychrophilum]
MRILSPSIRAFISAVGIGFAAALQPRGFRARLAISAAELNETLPVHSLWWRDHAKEDGELLYVAVGDSAAQGIGASRPNNSYVGILADHVRARTGRTVRVINLSVSGATVELAVRDQLPRFAALSPDLVTVAIGANDIAQWNAVLFEAGIRRVFEVLPSHALVAELPCFHLPSAERKVAVANRIVRDVAAERGLTVVPLHAATKRPGLRSVATHVAKDLFHPNDLGYRVWADAFLPSLTARVARRFAMTNDPAPESVGGRG